MPDHVRVECHLNEQESKLGRSVAAIIIEWRKYAALAGNGPALGVAWESRAADEVPTLLERLCRHVQRELAAPKYFLPRLGYISFEVWGG